MNGINGINTRTQLVNRDNELAAILRIGGRYVLVMNDPELAAMAAGQGVRVIYRESGDAPEDSPLAQDPAAFVRKRAEHAPAAYYIHALNEIDPSDEEQRWNREAFKYAKSIGRRLLVGNYATHRSREQWEFARPLLAEAAGAGHAIAFHHYVPPGSAAGGLEWVATKLSVGGLWICTEFAYGRYTADGQVDPHRGWRGITNAQERRGFIEKWSMYYSAKNIALLWFSYDFWDQPNVDAAKAEGFGYNDLPDVLDSFATFNQLYTVKDMPTTPDIPAPTEGGVKATLTKIPKDFINVRQQPNGNDAGDLLVGDVVTYYPDAPVVAGGTQWVYQTPLEPIERPTGRQNAALGWVSLQDGGVVFEKVIDPPVEPPTEETVKLKVSEVDAMIAANEQALAILRGAKLPGDGTKMLLDMPYVSQLGKDADSHNNDCLVADLLMCDRFLKKAKTGVEPDLPTVDMIVPATPLAGNPSALLTFNDGIALAKRLGFKVAYQSGMKPDAIRKSLDIGAPVIALVDYAKYNPAGKPIPHFMVISGYDGDAFITQDSYLMGANVKIEADTLDKAMKAVPGNTGEYQALTLAA